MNMKLFLKLGKEITQQFTQLKIGRLV